jgi:hypothetical protein
MSWEETDKLARKLGFKRLDPNSPLLRQIYGTTFIPGGFRVQVVDPAEEDASRRAHGSASRTKVPRAERGPEPKVCPFTTMHPEFGQGTVVLVPPSLRDDLLARRFGSNWYLDGIVHLLWDREHSSEDELNEGSHGLATNAPFSQGAEHSSVRRTAPVSIRRERRGRVVISQRSHASDPVNLDGGVCASMNIHRADPMHDEPEIIEESCICLATAPFTRWLVEGEAAERLEEALRRTDEIIEFGVPKRRSGLWHSTWLIGRPRGRGAALWPTAENARSTGPANGISVCVGDTCVADEIRSEFVRLNKTFGIPVPGKHHGDLDAASAWELLRKKEDGAR